MEMFTNPISGKSKITELNFSCRERVIDSKRIRRKDCEIWNKMESLRQGISKWSWEAIKDGDHKHILTG